MPPLHTLIAPSVLITPLWILLGAALGIHALWPDQISKRRVYFLIGYAIVSLLIISASWWNGVEQETKSTAQQQGYADQINGLNGQIKSLIGTAETLAQGVNALRDQVSKMSTAAPPNANVAAKDIAGRVAAILSGRTIDDAAAAKLVDALKKAALAKITITVVLGDPEAFQYATRLLGIFKTAGWNVEGLNQAVYGGPVTGLILQIADKAHVPAQANSVVAAFHDAGISIIGQENKGLGDADKVELVIGSKPAGAAQ